MSTLKNTYEHVGSTSSNLWTWKQVIYEYWEDNYLITNESTIVVKSYIGRASNAPKQYGYYSGNATLQTICNGESKSDGIRYYSHGYEGSSDNIGPGEYIEIDEKSFTVKHNSDGTKTLDVSTSLSTSSFSPSSASAIGTITLSTIPRASVFRDLGVVPVGSTVDDGIKFLIDKYYSGFYNKVELYYYNRLNSTWTLLSTEYDVNDGSVVTFTNNELNTLYANQPQQTKSFFKAELFTYTDNTYETMIDSNPDANTIVVRLVNFNLISPTFNGILYHDGNPTTVLLTQDDSIMVKGYSTLYIEIPYSYRAIANTRQTEMSHYVINGNSYPYNPSGSIDIPNDFENYDKDYVTSYAVDKRGVSSIMFNQYFGDNHFLNYSGITKDDGQSYSRNLNGVGPEVTINFSGKWWGDRPFGNNQDAVTNSLQASYKFKKTSASSYITGTTSIVLTLSKENPSDTYYTEYSFSGRINGDTSNNFDVSETYDIIVTVKDELSSVDIRFTITAGNPAIAIYKNKVALGAAYNETLGGTQLWGDVYLNGDTFPYPINSIYESTNNTNPGTLFGGTWTCIYDDYDIIYLNSQVVYDYVEQTILNNQIIDIPLQGTYEDPFHGLENGLTLPPGYTFKYRWTASIQTDGDVKVTIKVNNVMVTNTVSTWSNTQYRITLGGGFFELGEDILPSPTTDIGYSNDGYIHYVHAYNDLGYDSIIRVWDVTMHLYAVSDDIIYKWKRIS